MPETGRCMSLGQWTDRLVIVGIGTIFLWFGGKVETLTKRVETLCETMAGISVELKDTRAETDRLRADFDQHLRDERHRFTQDEQRKPLFGWRKP